MSVLYLRTRCWKYEIPSHVYFARDWCTTNQSSPAEIVIWSTTATTTQSSSSPSPSSSSSAAAAATAAPMVCMLKLTEIKTGIATTVRISEPNAGAMICRVEDSTRYFVLQLSSEKAAKKGVPLVAGVGFQTREDAAKFKDAVYKSLNLPADAQLPLFRGVNTSSIIAYVRARTTSSDAPAVAPPSAPQQQHKVVIEHVVASSPSVVVDLDPAMVAVPGDSSQDTPMALKQTAATRRVSHAPPTQLSQVVSTTPQQQEEDNGAGANKASDIHGEEPVVKVPEGDSQVEVVHASLEQQQQQQLQQQQAKQQLLSPQKPTATATAPSGVTPQPPEAAEPGVRVRKHNDEDNTIESWFKHRKHIFIISNSGKPIYSRYGDEQRLASFMASLMALVSFVADSNDTLRYISAGKRKYVFLMRGPIYLVAVCNTGEAISEIMKQLFYAHGLIVMVLTASTITKIFAKRPQYDLRPQITGADRAIDNILHEANHSPTIMLNAVHPLPLPAAVRAQVDAALSAAKCPELLFAILLAGTNLVQVARPKRFALDPVDIHLLMNFVNSSTSFRGNQTWTPICLPMFDDQGFLYAYICYLTHDICLVLLSTKSDAVYKLAECKDTITTAMEKSGALAAVAEACAKPHYRVGALGSTNLLHFLYKATNTRQMTAPALDAPYNTPAEQKRLLRVYQRVRSKIELGMAPHKVYYHVSQSETVVAWVTSLFELYATFSPLESKSQAIKTCNKVLVWILQQEADFFILSSPMW